jgi:hypothetical protein
MLFVIAMRFHSALTAVSPRRMKRRKAAVVLEVAENGLDGVSPFGIEGGTFGGAQSMFHPGQGADTVGRCFGGATLAAELGPRGRGDEPIGSGGDDVGGRAVAGIEEQRAHGRLDAGGSRVACTAAIMGTAKPTSPVSWLTSAATTMPPSLAAAWAL